MGVTEKKEGMNAWADFYKNQEKYSTPKLGRGVWQIANTVTSSGGSEILNPSYS